MQYFILEFPSCVEATGEKREEFIFTQSTKMCLMFFGCFEHDNKLCAHHQHVDVLNMLENCFLVTRPADAEQHYHSSGVLKFLDTNTQSLTTNCPPAAW